MALRDTAADNGSPTGDGQVTADGLTTGDGPVTADTFVFKMAWLDGVSTDSCDITRDMLKYIDKCAATFLVNLH